MPSETTPLSADVYAIRGDAAWWIFDVGACDEAADFINNLPCGVSVESPFEGTALHLHQDAAPLKKNIVISHFHRDHFFNLSRVKFDNLYVGRETYRHCDETIRALGFRGSSLLSGCTQPFRRSVTIVESTLQFEDGLRFRIEPIPSSHAKGSLMLTVGDDVPARNANGCDGSARDALDSICETGVAFLGDSTYPTVNHKGPDFYNVQLLYQQIQFLRKCSAQHFVMSHRRFVSLEKETVLQLLGNFYAQRQSHKNVIEVP